MLDFGARTPKTSLKTGRQAVGILLVMGACSTHQSAFCGAKSAFYDGPHFLQTGAGNVERILDP